MNILVSVVHSQISNGKYMLYGNIKKEIRYTRYTLA